MKKLVSLLISIFITFTLFAESRNALLIANQDYKYEGSLSTPINEAKDLKIALENVGFTVTLIENAGLDTMSDALYTFKKTTSSDGGIGLFHYGGHAVQINGNNYLLPVDKNIQDEIQIQSRAINVDDVMSSMQADSNIVILDACRNNPLKALTRGTTRGLSLVQAKPKNSIIVYSAEAGSTAQDGMFTPILTKHISDNNSFTSIIREVRKEVRKNTNEKQVPGCYDQLDTDIYLANENTPKIEPSEKPVVPATVKPSTVNPKKYVVRDDYPKEGFEYYAKGLNYYSNQDYTNAIKYLKIAEEMGNIDAIAILGYCYDFGYGMEKDPQKAFTYYTTAAEYGCPSGIYDLGLCYEFGTYVEIDYNIAIELYEISQTPESKERIKACYKKLKKK